VCYEGRRRRAGQRFERDELVAELVGCFEAGDPDAVMETFMRRVTRMDDAAIAAYRANPVWRRASRRAPTVPRELVAARLDPPERFEGWPRPCCSSPAARARPCSRRAAAWRRCSRTPAS
jgi:hypothetical protein